MHQTTFEYIKPTDKQMSDMQFMRDRATEYGAAINTYVPDGPDKTYIVRKLREVAMWVTDDDLDNVIRVLASKKGSGSEKLDTEH